MSRWMIWTLVAVVSWGVWAILAKGMGDSLSAAHSQALSTLGLLPVIGVLAFSQQLSANPAGGQPRKGRAWASAAGLMTCLGNAAYYDVLQRGTKAANVVPLTALYPLVTVFLAVLLLKEKLNRIQCLGVVMSLVAIYLFNVQQEHGMISSWLIYALIPIVLWGIAGLLQKISTQHLSGERATLWFLGAFIPVALIIIWRAPLPPGLSGRTWVMVIALGLFFAVGNLALLKAFASHGKASVIGPLAGLYPVVSLPIAIFFFGERIGVRETIGIILALTAVVALAMETRKHDPVINPTAQQL